jgi:hypothetical protein
LDAAQRQVLTAVANCLTSLGSANDAEDHGYLEDAQRMRSEACASLQSLLQDHPFLVEYLPVEEVERGSARLLAYGWHSALEVIRGQLKST